MGAAAGGIKNVIKNVDDYLLRPLGEGLFRFNMQFDFDPAIRGDLEVRARGTESLMANEVRSQRLMQFMQVSSSPALAPFAKFQYIIREIAKSLDLDPDKVTNNMDEAAIQAELMKQFQQPAPTPEQGGAPAGANPMDPSGAGGGTIGTGQVPLPQEQGFSANGQGNIPQAQGLVNNPKQWTHFNNYLEELIKQQHRLMEQTEDVAPLHRAQGAIHMLRNIQRLRDNVIANN